MARNKNSTALFDVIHSAKKPPKASPSASIPTPKWWGKDKKLPKPAAPESTENAGRQQSWLTAAKKNAGAISPPPPAASAHEPAIEPFYTEHAGDDLAGDDLQSASLDPSAEIELATRQPAGPKPRFIDRFKNRPAAAEPEPVVEEIHVPPAVADEPDYSYSEPVEMEIKPQKAARHSIEEEQEIPARFDSREVRLSYGFIIALVFIVMMALAIAFIAGTRTNSQAISTDSSDMAGSPTTSPTSGMMAAVGPAQATTESPVVHPDVMQVAPRTAVSSAAKPTVVSTTPPLPIKSTRDIGMIYVVVQSYAEQDLAQRACDYMNKSGIPCSLVQGPDGWAPRDWYSVVGLQPFARHDPGLADYERAVKAAGVRFTSKIMDQFQPQGYTWRETSDLSQQ